MAFFTENSNTNVTHRLGSDRQQTIRVCHSNIELGLNEYAEEEVGGKSMVQGDLGVSVTSLDLSDRMVYGTETSSVDSSTAFKQIRLESKLYNN